MLTKLAQVITELEHLNFITLGWCLYFYDCEVVYLMGSSLVSR